MSMFNKVGELVDGASGGYNMPEGTHPALITDVTPNEATETVDLKLNFNGTTAAPRYRLFLGGQDPEKVKSAHLRIAKQLKNVFGTPITNGAQMERAIMALEGKYVLVEVTNRKGSEYQNYWLKGPHTTPRGADVAAGPDGAGVDSDLPF